MVVQNSLQAWLLAARPKTLTAASVPVMTGSVMAWDDCAPSPISWFPVILCFLFAFVMQIDANFINDYFDFKHGNDDETRLGPKRACAEGWVTSRAMIVAIALTTALACLIGLPLIYYGGLEMLVIGVFCVIFCFLYTTLFSYLGMGDVLVLVFFGIIPVCCTYHIACNTLSMQVLSICRTVSVRVFLASIACGLVIDTLLLVNNFRDYDNDKNNNKNTLIVHIGKKWGCHLYLLFGIIGCFLMEGCLFFGSSSNRFALIPLCLYLIIHYSTWMKMKRIWSGRPLNEVLGYTARNILFFGLLTVCSFYINQF